ncbi:MAG TPA: hypothetical protein VEJ18_02745 [Planctomycetota bacterium]|nr:hypothetical protein [Planctomycetota bacterium]
MSTRLGLVRKAVPALALAVCLGAGFVRAAQEALRTRAAAPGQENRRIFIDRCLAAIPPDAEVYLVADPRPYFTSTELYPRRVRVAQRGDIPRLKRESPGAWVIVFTDRSDDALAAASLARDLAP